MQIYATKRALLCLALLAFLGCTDQQQQRALDQRQSELDQREAKLQEREAELARREAQAERPAEPADSLAAVSQGLTGRWMASMTCTETNCPGSAVGDTKTEEWQISYEPPALVARALANGQLVRVYSGFFTGNTVELVERHADSAGQPSIRMVARLSIVDSLRMEGQREITRTDCKTIYSLQLARQ
jgi:hypothetical protein